MKKILSAACAFLMGVSCIGIPAKAEFTPDNLDLSSLENLENLDFSDLDLEDLNLEDFTFDYESILSAIREKLETYIKESGIDAEVLLKDGTISIGISYDYAETRDKIKAFMEENGIDSSLVNFEMLEKVISLLMGDATGDNDVNILDVIVVNKAMMGKETLTEEQLKAIDFNGNGKPDAGEAQDILKYIVGLVESLSE